MVDCIDYDRTAKEWKVPHSTIIQLIFGTDRAWFRAFLRGFLAGKTDWEDSNRINPCQLSDKD